MSTFFAIVAIVHFGLLILTRHAGNGMAAWIVRALLIGLLYDNTVLALSDAAIESSWYYSASWLRFVAHVLVLPPLVVAALQIGGRAGLQWSGSRPALLAGIAFTVSACAFGFVTEIAGLELILASFGDHVRFVSADAMPPVATIVTNVVVLVLAALIWKKARWPWLFVAALLIFLVNGVAVGRPWAIVAGNIAEVVFALGWVMTLLRFNPAVIDNSHMPDD